MDHDIRKRLEAEFRWVGGRFADVTGWWRDPRIIAGIGPAIAELSPEPPTLIMGPQSRGSLLGALVAVHLGVGLLEVRKEAGAAVDDDPWYTATTPPDFRDRHLTMGVRRRHLAFAGERVLFVDDWADTGGQITACHHIIEQSAAEWLGAAVVVDDLSDPALRRRMRVRSLLRGHDL